MEMQEAKDHDLVEGHTVGMQLKFLVSLSKRS